MAEVIHVGLCTLMGLLMFLGGASLLVGFAMLPALFIRWLES